MQEKTSDATQNLCAAVKDLRKRLQLTQTEFGQRIQRTLPTVQRYENFLAPTGTALQNLIRLAEQHGYSDLAEMFRHADAATAATTANATVVVTAMLLKRSIDALGSAGKDSKELDVADLAVRKAFVVLQRIASHSDAERGGRNEDELRRAVRELRTRLVLTQTKFGSLIGKGLATVQRYEGLVAPSGGVLGDLSNLAAVHGHFDLHRTFYKALKSELARIDNGIKLLSLQQLLMTARISILSARSERTQADMAKHIETAKRDLRKAVLALKQRAVEGVPTIQKEV